VAIVRIERSDDPRLGGYASLADAPALRRRGWFVAEGRFVVERLLCQPGYVIESLLLNDAAHRALEPLLDSRAPDVPTYVCPASLFLGLTGHDFHRGCLALVTRPSPLQADDLVASARALVVLEGVTNADNVGGVFRNAAAFGVDAVLLSPTCADPLYRKAIRTSMAQTLRVPFATLGGAVNDPWPACLSRLAAQGFELLALTPQEPSIEIDERLAQGAPGRFALLVGTEGGGLGAEALRLATCRLRIAMSAEVDSLNLAVATGIALQRLMSARRG
jgi:tRNA G18 (ribose-2'-O)-methylase SpoU